MNPEQKRLVQETFAQIAPNAAQASNLFYYKLFSLEPKLRSLFPADMHEQERKLILTLNMIVFSLDQLEDFVPLTYELGKRHIDYGVKSEDYATAWEALIFMLEKMLDSKFTPEMRSAWQTVYNFLVETMLLATVDLPSS